MIDYSGVEDLVLEDYGESPCQFFSTGRTRAGIGHGAGASSSGSTGLCSPNVAFPGRNHYNCVMMSDDDLAVPEDAQVKDVEVEV